jgi:hypothetical protein
VCLCACARLVGYRNAQGKKQESWTVKWKIVVDLCLFQSWGCDRKAIAKEAWRGLCRKLAASDKLLGKGELKLIDKVQPAKDFDDVPTGKWGVAMRVTRLAPDIAQELASLLASERAAETSYMALDLHLRAHMQAAGIKMWPRISDHVVRKSEACIVVRGMLWEDS